MEKHVHYFDHLRLIALISVIYMHVAAGPLRSSLGPERQIINIFTCIGFTAVPLFFMMSGYLLLSNPKTENMNLLFKKRVIFLCGLMFSKLGCVRRVQRKREQAQQSGQKREIY